MGILTIRWIILVLSDGECSYQNIVRTIQNVLLNSRLEADYIKQTIITSLNEEDSVIDLTRYRSHCAGFESQLSDIGTFRDPGMMRKANGIVSLFDDIRKRNLRINDLCRQLRSAYLQTESVLPELARKIHEKEEIKSDFIRSGNGWIRSPRNGRRPWKRSWPY